MLRACHRDRTVGIIILIITMGIYPGVPSLVVEVTLCPLLPWPLASPGAHLSLSAGPTAGQLRLVFSRDIWRRNKTHGQLPTFLIQT